MPSGLIIVWAYLTVCAALGFIGIPKMKTLKDYALGPQQFSTSMLSISMIATLIGPAETIGWAEKSFSMGAVFTITGTTQIFRWWIMGAALGPMVERLRRSGCLTLVDIMKFLYGKLGRYLCCSVGLIVSLAILAVFYKSAAFILERYLNIPFVMSASIITLTVAIYSIFGGMHAVVVTDIIQFFVFMIFFPIILIFGLNSLDVQSIWSSLPYEKTHIVPNDIPLFCGLLIYSIIPITGLPYIQRGLMSENERQLKNMFFSNSIVSFVFAGMISFMGMLAFGMDPTTKSDDALFVFIDQCVPQSLMGFIAISFLAIIMSTASSLLNAINVVMVKDVITPFFPSLKENNKDLVVAKFIGMVVVLLSFVMIFMKEHIWDMFWALDNFWDPFVSIPLLLGLFGFRIRPEKYKYVVGITLTSILVARLFHDSFDPVTLVVGVVTSAATIMIFRDKSISKSDNAADFEKEKGDKLNGAQVVL